jgi:hypothetical protein
MRILEDSMRNPIYPAGVFLLLMAACTNPSEPEQSLQVTVAVSRSVVPAGDTLSITVTAFNPTRSEVVLRPAGGCMPLDYRMYDAAGERLAPPVGLSCAVAGGLPEGWNRLGPGESRQVTHRWSAIYDYHVAGVPLRELPPGDYRVVGGIAQEPDLGNPSEPVVIRVEARRGV